MYKSDGSRLKLSFNLDAHTHFPNLKAIFCYTSYSRSLPKTMVEIMSLEFGSLIETGVPSIDDEHKVLFCLTMNSWDTRKLKVTVSTTISF